MSFNYLIIDGNNLCWRAGSVLFLSNAEGGNTSVAYGALGMIRHLIEDYQPRSVVFCWDKGVSTAKVDLYPDYKKERHSKSELPEGLVRDIIIQINDLQKVLPYFGIKQIIRQGVEADDLIGLLCKSLGGVLVCSGDKGLLQVVGFGSSLYLPHKNRIINQSNFLEEVGVPFELYPYYLSVVGHSGGGIPGLQSFGPVTAKKLLKKFGPWENWYINGHIRIGVLEAVNKTQKEIILSHDTLSILDRNYKLVLLGGLVEDIKDELVAELISQKPVLDEEAIKKFFADNQFVKYLSSFRGWIHPFRKLGGG